MGQVYPDFKRTELAGMRDKPEEIVSKLRQVEGPQGQRMRVSQALRQIGGRASRHIIAGASRMAS